MGCWNQTCFITNTPIMADDKVYIFTLVQNPWGERSRCYPNTYFAPLPYFFEGHYNEYGSADRCSGPTMNKVLEFVRKYLFEVEQGENQYHDIPVKKEDLDIEKMFEADHETRLFIKNPYGTSSSHDDMKLHPEKLRVTFIMCRKEILDKLLSDFKVEWIGWERPESGNGNWRTKTVSYRDVQKRVSAYVKEKRDKIADLQAKLEALDEYKEHTDEMRELAKRYLSQQTFYKYYDDASNRINVFEGRDRFYTNSGVQFDLIEAMDSDNDELINAIVEQTTKSFMLCTYMDNGRMMWIPPSGAGSQDDSTDAQELRGTLTKYAAKLIKSRWDNYED